MRNLLLFIFGLIVVGKIYSQKLDLPLDSAKNIVYNYSFPKEHLTKSELFNIIMNWVKSDIKAAFPIIQKDTIQFFREIPAYSTEFGGLTFVGKIKYKTTIIIEEQKFAIQVNQIYYLDNESKEPILAEEILTNKDFMDKWHCLLDMDKSVKDLIYESDKKTAKKARKKQEKFIYEAEEDNSVSKNLVLDNVRLKKAQEENKKASSRIVFGTATMILGSLVTLYSVNEYQGLNRRNAVLVGTGVVLTGLIVSINGIQHQRKVNKLLCDNIKKRELSLQIGLNNISFAYKF